MVSRAGAFALLALAAGCNALLGVDKDYVETGPSTTTAAGGGAGQGGEGEAAEGGGGGGPLKCRSVTDCPLPANPCEARICQSNLCGTVAVEFGKPAAGQKLGDCRFVICDGTGSSIDQVDDTDVPVDGKSCTEDVCNQGTPSNPPLALGAPCAENGGIYCDGEGDCVACNSPAECPGEDGECQTRTCTGHLCGFAYAPAGTPLALQKSGDCQKLACDGAGKSVSQPDDTDVPFDDNPCTSDACTAGVPSNPPAAMGTPCGALFCNGAGQCAGCTSPSDCPGSDTFCQTRTCSTNLCGFSYTAAGTALPAQDQVSADCQQKQCNGSGGIQAVADDGDVPKDDGNQCTAEACANGASLHPPEPLNASCTQNGIVCDGAGKCVACNSPGQCTNQGTVCQSATCVNNACGLANTAAGTAAPASAQTAKDCKLVVCDGNGGTSTQADDGDLPVDNNDCTADVCMGTTPSNPPLAQGTACGVMGKCDGAGNCSEPKPNGEPCAAGGECVSGYCVDGYCCDSACTATCKACSMQKTGGANGTCAFIPNGKDPDAECGAGKRCDGAGACTTCGNGTCDPGETSVDCPADCTGVVAVAGGEVHSCAMLSNGTAKCWGRNAYGQLGDGTITDRPTPVNVIDITTAKAITCGRRHGCVLLGDGTARCWGDNEQGGLGNGTTSDSPTPVVVTGLSDAVAVAAGDRFSCALRATGGIQCWGWNLWGQLGNGKSGAQFSSKTPVDVSGITTAIALAAGGRHACAVLQDGAARCWGRNDSGQLGDGTNTDSNVPVAVSGITSAATVVAGVAHVCARLTDDTARCWGYNYYGQLGDGTTVSSTTPVTVQGLAGALVLAPGVAMHTCAALGDLTARCWGRNYQGQLGNGANLDSPLPVTVFGLTTVKRLGTGGYHTCAALSDGTARCWGYNYYGQLGNGTTTDSNVPVQPVGL
jgi:alpha-tubulin suppressor-like RCC1 family protein